MSSRVSQVCAIPPPGWFCTREPGHDGPCAAVAFPGSESFEDVKLLVIAFAGGMAGAIVGLLIAWSLS